jgi:DNA invertase Pin-like site-specific DNA recombinase
MGIGLSRASGVGGEGLFTAREAAPGPTRTPPGPSRPGPVIGVLRRSTGKMLGRPAISTAAEAAIRKALKKGDVGIRKIATTLGVGTGTVQRIKAEMAAVV